VIKYFFKKNANASSMEIQHLPLRIKQLQKAAHQENAKMLQLSARKGESAKRGRGRSVRAKRNCFSSRARIETGTRNLTRTRTRQLLLPTLQSHQDKWWKSHCILSCAVRKCNRQLDCNPFNGLILLDRRDLVRGPGSCRVGTEMSQPPKLWT